MAVYKSKAGSEIDVLRKNIGVMDPFAPDEVLGDFEPQLEAAGDESDSGDEGETVQLNSDAQNNRAQQRRARSQVLNAVDEVLGSEEYKQGGIRLMDDISNL
jgi:hypothetical protein